MKKLEKSKFYLSKETLGNLQDSALPRAKGGLSPRQRTRGLRHHDPVLLYALHRVVPRSSKIGAAPRGRPARSHGSPVCSRP